MATANEDGSLRPTAVLAVFCESLVAGRRTAVLGDSSDALHARLAGASRRRVHVFDPDRQRVASAIAASRGGSVAIDHAPLDATADVAEASFDAVLIPDLGAFRDPGEVLDIAVRLLGPRGLLVLTSANPDCAGPGEEAAIGYYDLFDLVAERFERVRMFGQAPFAGYTVAEFAAGGEPPVTIDASLVASSEASERFVVVASRAPIEVDPYLLVQVPSAEMRGWTPPEAEPVVDTAALAEAQGKLERLEAALEKARAAERTAQQQSAEREAALTKAAARLAELQSQADRRQEQLTRDLNAAHKHAEALKKRLTQSEGEIARHRAERERLEEAHQEELDRMLERIAELEDAAEAKEPSVRPAFDARGYEFQLGELRDALAKARAERDDARAGAARAVELEAEVGALTRDRDALRTELADAAKVPDEEEHGREIAALERALRDRGHVAERLRAELAESERIGRELVQRLGAAAPRPSDGAPDADALRGQVEALSQRCARCEADLHAATWKVAALTRELEDRREAADQGKLEDALRAAHEELGALRLQLAERR
jgi:SAM-dependent methyltransferase